MSEVTADPLVTQVDGHWQGQWDDGYTVLIHTEDTSRAGIYRAELEVLYQGTSLNAQTVDLLSARSREEFHVAMAARNGATPVVWDLRLGAFYRELRAQQARMPAYNPWTHVQTAQAFLQQQDEDLQATVKDFLIPGCTTIVSAPRGSGKSFVMLFLAVALAQGGIFRMERLATQRVLLIDRDNPEALVRTRLRSLGADDLTTLHVLTRASAPPLTDKTAWARFPADDYDVLLIDSLSAFTEGVSEKEGKQTQEFLAVLKDLAARGLALLILANTNKAGINIRGRGEQPDAVDLVYEARNMTGWEPEDGPNWWESLPEAGEQAWQQNTTRRLNATNLRIGFVPTKTRLGATPTPFVLDMDTTTTPWSMTDVTTLITHEGTQAREAKRSAQRQKLDAAAEALAAHLHTLPPRTPMLKTEAETWLREEHHLTQRQARTLLENGSHHDAAPEGLWVLREMTGQRGHPVGVYLTGDDPRARVYGGIIDDGNNPNLGDPHKTSPVEQPISGTRMAGGARNTAPVSGTNSADFKGADFGRPQSSDCPKSAPLSPAEILEETEGVLFRSLSDSPADLCQHAATTTTPMSDGSALVHCATCHRIVDVTTSTERRG
jgi:AAA domain